MVKIKLALVLLTCFLLAVFVSGNIFSQQETFHKDIDPGIRSIQMGDKLIEIPQSIDPRIASDSKEKRIKPIAEKVRRGLTGTQPPDDSKKKSSTQ